MVSEVMIRRFTRADEAQAVRLLLSGLPPGEADTAFPIRLERWRWQYYENPSNPEGQPVLWVAEADGSVGGVIGLLVARLRTPKGIVEAAWGNDLIVGKEMRGTGLGRKLDEKWQHTLSVALGRGWSERAYAIHMKLGFTTVTGFTTGWFILSRINFARLLIHRNQRRNLARLAFAPPRFRRPGQTCDSVVGDKVPEVAGDLWAKVSGSYPFAVERDLTHLRWRYEGHPTHKYEFIQLTDSGEPTGLAVVRTTDDSPAVGIICELIVDPGKPESVRSLVKAAVSHLRAKRVCAALVDVPPRLSESVFSTGLPCIKETFTIVVFTDDDDLANKGIGDARNWYFSRGDSDADF
jgi:GNAT superfamily N-acetyltransferase